VLHLGRRYDRDTVKSRKRQSSLSVGPGGALDRVEFDHFTEVRFPRIKNRGKVHETKSDLR
jgi:hypothetical protein